MAQTILFPHFLLNNILQALGKTGLTRLVHDVVDPAKSPVITKEMLSELTHRIVHDPVEEREAGKKLTGEWIIYLRHEAKNHYLCCNTHDAGPTEQRSRNSFTSLGFRASGRGRPLQSWGTAHF
jgi:hypothetical protein